MPDVLRCFVGYDPREAVAYHVCCQSILENTKYPVSFHPVRGERRDGSNDFIYARFLVPWLCGFSGSAVFVDGDMIVRGDISDLFALRRLDVGAQCVQHAYKTKHPTKYLGNKNEDYPRKNWSSVILWNCGHYANRILTPELVAEASGKQVHRFEWLRDEQIDDLPGEWNHLVGEYPEKESKLYHFTLGVPGFERYARDEGAVLWHEARERMNHLVGV